MRLLQGKWFEQAMNLIFFAAEKYTSQADNNLSVNIKDEKKRSVTTSNAGVHGKA